MSLYYVAGVISGVKMRINYHQIAAHSKGFSLLELIIVLVLFGIIFSFALPAYENVKISTDLNNQTTTFQQSLLYTRSEAVKRNRNMTMCKSANTDTANPTCTTNGTWDSGWIVFADENANGAVDAGEDLLRIGEQFKDGYTLDGSLAFNDLVVFQPTGVTPSQGFFVMCKDNDSKYSNVLVITVTGRIKNWGQRFSANNLNCSY